MRSGVWSGSISFGLLNIPVTLKSAQEDKEIHFSMMDEKALKKIQSRKQDPWKNYFNISQKISILKAL